MSNEELLNSLLHASAISLHAQSRNDSLDNKVRILFAETLNRMKPDGSPKMEPAVLREVLRGKMFKLRDSDGGHTWMRLSVEHSSEGPGKILACIVSDGQFKGDTEAFSRSAMVWKIIE